MATLVWRRTIKGVPSLALVQDDFLDEYCRTHKVATHKLKPGEENLPLDDLAKLYPPPPKENDDG